VKDSNGQKLAYVYYEGEPGRRSAAKLLTIRSKKGHERSQMAEPEVKLHGVLNSSGAARHNSATRSTAAMASLTNRRGRQRFVGSVMKPKSGGSNWKKLTTMVGGPCSSPSLL